MKATLGAGLTSLHGKLGNLCGKVINGRQQLGKLSKPYSINGENPTHSQDLVKYQYALAVKYWRAATPAEKAAWDLLGAPMGISGFNYMLMINMIDQTDIQPDGTEATTLTTPIVTLEDNLNRIRHWIIALSGEAWGTVTTSTAALLAKFHATTGHKHTGAASDGPTLDHGLLTGLTDDDHTRYFDKNGGKGLTAGTIKRDVKNNRLLVTGGDGNIGQGASFSVYGVDYVSAPGSFYVYTPNAAKDNEIVVFYVTGSTDTPSLNLNGHKIVTLANPTSAQDAATKFYVDSRAPLLKRGATSCADGGTITHGLGTTPTTVVVSPSVANEIITVTAIGATTFTVAIKKRADGLAGTTQTIYWIAC